MEKPIVSVIGRRWFQRTYGNTYHTVSVIMPDGSHIRSPMTYGYGSQYLETAAKLIEATGLFPPRELRDRGMAPEALWKWFDRIGVELHETVIDVQRQKDL